MNRLGAQVPKTTLNPYRLNEINPNPFTMNDIA